MSVLGIPIMIAMRISPHLDKKRIITTIDYQQI
jgi:hypothetical protein